MQTQENAYKAIFNHFWDKKWFAGGFLWKWHTDVDKAQMRENSDYTPQQKPVLDIIKKRYKNES